MTLKRLGLVLGICFLYLFSFRFTYAQDLPQDEMLEGRIVDLQSEYKTDGLAEEYLYQTLQIEVTKGSLKGQTIEVVNDTFSVTRSPEYEVGDGVVVMYSKNFDGQDIFYITDYIRRDGMLILFALFVFLAILIGGIWGATSLIGMGLSFLVIFKFVLPQIIAGRDAVTIAVLGSAMIIPITFSLSHGLNKKTLIAGIGTVITLILTGLLAAFAVRITHLTGYGSEEAAFLQVQVGEVINIKGLLLAGMIIASLGVLDDITISQSSVVDEIRKANKKLKSSQIFARAMNVGRDHIASLVNTLVLVYAGASLPLLLLFINNPSPFSEIINIELIAEEVVSTLVGSIGLIMAVPITTFLATNWYRK